MVAAVLSAVAQQGAMDSSRRVSKERARVEWKYLWLILEAESAAAEFPGLTLIVHETA